MKLPERHDILTLNEAGRREAEKSFLSRFPGAEKLLQRYPDLPVICTGKRDNVTGRILVGFSFPLRENGNRVRASAQVSPEGIAAVTDPWSVPIGRMTDMHQPVQMWGPYQSEQTTDPRPLEQMMDPQLCFVIREIRELTAALGADAGFFGSAAMEACTGLPYIGENSDVDLVIRDLRRESLLPLAEKLACLERETGIHTDAEVRVEDLYIDPEVRTEAGNTDQEMRIESLNIDSEMRNEGLYFDLEVRNRGVAFDSKNRDGEQTGMDIPAPGYVKLQELAGSQATVIVRGSGNPFLAGRSEAIKHLR